MSQFKRKKYFYNPSKKTLLVMLAMLFSFFFISTLTGCTTRFKKAQNLIADKNYEEAESLLLQLTNEDPTDTDYQAELRKARLGLIGEWLIRVRMARLGENITESFELLRKTISKENQWKLFPTGAVAFTQAEETDEAIKNFQKELSSLAQRRQHLRVIYYLSRYKILFSEAQIKKFEIYKNEALDEAKNFCLEKAKLTSEKTFFYNHLIEQWCQLAGQKAKIAEAKNPLYNQIKFIPHPSAENQTPGHFIPQFVAAGLTKSATTALKNSGWYSRSANQDWEVRIEGQYNYTSTTLPETRLHHYTVQIPYTAYEQEYYTNPQTGQTESRQVSKTKYRDEDRSVWYTGFRTSQKVMFNADFTLAPTPIFTTKASPQKWHHYFSETAESFSHNNSIPAASLYPSTTGFTQPEPEWIEKIAEKLQPDFKAHLRTQFEQLFCNNLNETWPQVRFINQAVLCLRQIEDQENAVIDRIVKKEFQMTFLEMNNLFDVFD